MNDGELEKKNMENACKHRSIKLLASDRRKRY